MEARNHAKHTILQTHLNADASADADAEMPMLRPQMAQ